MSVKNRVYILILGVLLVPLSSIAQEYSYDDIVANLEENSQPAQSPKAAFGATSTEFHNVAYNLSGRMYTASVNLSQRSEYALGLDVPYIMGKNTGIQTEELGNPQFKSRFNVWQMTPEFSFWIPVSARLGLRGNNHVIASHHDTYRMGLDADYSHGKISTTIGAGYQARILEEDPDYDIGDIIDYKMAVRYALTETITAQGVMQWYRVSATQIEKKEIGKGVDWASFAPGLAFRILDGLDFSTSIVFPILQTGTPMETDLAFGEIYYPQTSGASLAWGLGANF